MTSRELFDQAIEVVLAHEGDAYTDLPFDCGGPTKYGISQRWNPDIDVRDLMREQAIEIYWERYWQGHRYDLLPAAVAIKVFDLTVNLGAVAVIACLQRALWASGSKVVIDGVLGPETCAATGRAVGAVLLAALRSEAAGEYRVRVARDPGQEAFAEGWMERAYA